MQVPCHWGRTVELQRSNNRGPRGCLTLGMLANVLGIVRGPQEGCLTRGDAPGGGGGALVRVRLATTSVVETRRDAGTDPRAAQCREGVNGIMWSFFAGLHLGQRYIQVGNAGLTYPREGVLIKYRPFKF